MKTIAGIVIVALCAGCLSKAPEPPVAWTIDVCANLAVSSVEVAAPYDGSRFAVLRPDGSVAFDAFNVFASRPAAIIRDGVGLADVGPDLMVRKLALDCRQEGARLALVELELRQAGKTIGSASASVPTDDGDYSKAFSTAFAQAAAKLSTEVKL